MRPDRILDLEVRRRLYERVRSFPGMHLRALAREEGLQTNHAKYHLRQLERHGLVSSRREDGYWMFWPREEGSHGYRDQVDRQTKGILALLRRPVPLHVTLLLLDREEANHSSLLDDVDVAHSTLHYHLKKMEGAGLLQSRRDGKSRVYSLVDPGTVEELLVSYRPPQTIIRRFLEAWEALDLEVAAGSAPAAAPVPPSDDVAADGRLLAARRLDAAPSSATDGGDPDVPDDDVTDRDATEGAGNEGEKETLLGVSSPARR